MDILEKGSNVFFFFNQIWGNNIDIDNDEGFSGFQRRRLPFIRIVIVLQNLQCRCGVLKFSVFLDKLIT